MKPVIQEQETGCGIACAATLAHLTYAQTKTIANQLGVSAEDPQLWSTTPPLRQLLAHLKIKIAKSEKPFFNWKTLPNCALIALKWQMDNGTPSWHWAIFVRENEGEDGYVLDPAISLKSNRRTDFARMKPKWFIKVNI